MKEISTQRWQFSRVLCISLLVLAVAFVLDAPVTQLLYDYSFHNEDKNVFKGTSLARSIKWFGDIRVVLGIVLLLMALAKLHWRRAFVVMLCSAMAGLNDCLKIAFGRVRPIADDGSISGTFDFAPFTTRSAGNALPSGHAMLVFAAAYCIARYYPRWAPAAYIVAGVVALERVVEVAHHFSDVVAAALMAMGLSYLCMRLLERWSEAPARALAQRKSEVAEAAAAAAKAALAPENVDSPAITETKEEIAA